MVKVSRQSFRSLVIVNIRVGSGITKKLIDSLIREIIQNDIAEMFLKERTGRGELKKPRSKQYIAWKARQSLPFGNKRGHLHGKLQRTLDRNVLWTTNYRRPTAKQPGRATIILNNKKLNQLVDYYKYYAKDKTSHGAGVLIVLKKHVNEIEKQLRKQEKGGVKKGSVNKAFSRAVKKANNKTKRRRRA